MNTMWLRKWQLQHVVLVLLLLVLSVNYAALGYYQEILSQRDYSAIRDPHSRVTYCMVSGTSISDKYTLADSIAHESDFQVFSAVMKSAQRVENQDEVRAAIRALKVRDELHERAHLISSRVAAACGFWAIKWPKEVTPGTST